jgi:hypothetical protein
MDYILGILWLDYLYFLMDFTYRFEDVWVYYICIHVCNFDEWVRLPQLNSLTLPSAGVWKIIFH